MTQKNILVVGQNPEILEVVLRVLNQNSAWKGTGASTPEEALSLFEQQNFDLVLLGGGLSVDSELLLRQTFATQKPEVPVVQHYGGGSGLLANEITEALTSISA